ncbi:MAG: HAD family phosphatase [Dysgonamonadaceae bacterium]|jgi:HAD superfamily hydrolase (TIGR01509 family)|nr:HAD family phosphatase [Dysgonamonadaceae bacterium]
MSNHHHSEIAFLFDLDGVIIDTEPQYDRFWNKAGKEYHSGVENLEKLIKGTTLSNIMSRYFSHLPDDKQKELEAANHAFDLQLEMNTIPGALEFLVESKKAGIKTGLVTSSDNEKLTSVFRKLSIRQYFDTVVSADRITAGKPDPMCYLLAAKDLNIPPENCYVFEDSFSGIAAGNAAGMKVVGLSTTNAAENIRSKVWKVIPNFIQFTLPLQSLHS